MVTISVYLGLLIAIVFGNRIMTYTIAENTAKGNFVS
jgi:hypothetical protein